MPADPRQFREATVGLSLRGYARRLATALRDAPVVTEMDADGLILLTASFRDQLVSDLESLAERDEDYVENLRQRVESCEKVLLPRDGEPQ